MVFAATQVDTTRLDKGSESCLHARNEADVCRSDCIDRIVLGFAINVSSFSSDAILNIGIAWVAEAGSDKADITMRSGPTMTVADNEALLEKT